MLAPLLAGITSFIISFAFLPFVITFSKKKNLLTLQAKGEFIKK